MLHPSIQKTITTKDYLVLFLLQYLGTLIIEIIYGMTMSFADIFNLILNGEIILPGKLISQYQPILLNLLGFSLGTVIYAKIKSIKLIQPLDKNEMQKLALFIFMINLLPSFFFGMLALISDPSSLSVKLSMSNIFADLTEIFSCGLFYALTFMCLTLANKFFYLPSRLG